MTGIPSAWRACSLEELKKEPWRLQIQTDTTAEQLRGLVLRNYHVFIQSNQSANIVKDELSELKKQTSSIMSAIPELKAFCASVQEQTADIVAKHSDIQFVFDHYLELTELLEIPQLLEACIHSEQFDSALDVIHFAKETFQNDLQSEAKDHHPKSNFVIQALVREVGQMAVVLREKLLQKLREDLQLARCVRIVSYLRRLDALEDSSLVGTPAYEKQLKEEFLRCRSTWLASLTRAIATTDAYQYTIQLIDINRTSWFDLITQYSAIFGSGNIDGKVDPPLCRWATTTVADFIQVLMRHLPKIEDFSSLATVVEQSLFFGGSLGRVGVDFRAVLVVYFEDHVFDLLARSWEGACRDLQESLRAHALDASSSTSSRLPIVLATYRASLASATGQSLFTTASEEDLAPPRILMSFPILAEFTNAILASFNDLRLCTIASLQHRLAHRLQATLRTLVEVVREFIVDNQLKLQPRASGDDDAKETTAKVRASKATVLADAVRDMSQVTASDLLPYVARCFDRLFPVVSTSKKTSAAKSALDVASLVEQMRDAGLLLSEL